MYRGIPIVSPARALLDFAPDARGDELERAIAETYVRKLTTETELRRVIARNPHRAGVGVLRAELAPGDVVLVKGSRSAGLDRLATVLIADVATR